ncbi:polynucleotide adenylyltransferase PcnB [Pusillimonas sp. CC-YST705]|uniref:Poly(A) polymerase I n=1 Tax=Mesopusillimonas faecipullorum TaxID=2755040 RepID=A0ABS8CET4_9BURK|nr:polynucleotide adenylyltransferase PcnB [Mesopusillimonas faecipullorum]MCB5364523.1 polynucleotide adenylyltransferase PcnB [Mesopusillimonas faecipullorum]
MVTATIKKFVSRLILSRKRVTQRFQASQHGIDRRNVSRHAIKVCEVLDQHGFKAYIVGGAVRDLIVGLVPKDFDVATNATPEQIRPLFRRARIIGRRFKLVHIVFGQEIIETSTFRAPADQGEDTDEHGRIISDNLYGTHEQDAARRDFTLNALYYDPLKEEVIDFHHGVNDLKKRTVRMIGDPALRYREDPVRMLRAVRFASKLDGTIAPATLAPIRELAPLLAHVPSSRLFDEVLKLLTCGRAMQCLQQTRELGMLRYLLPQIESVLEQPDGAAFIDMALNRTDARIHAGKSTSPSYLFASLLWKLVSQRWQSLVSAGEPRQQALMQAIDDILEDRKQPLTIQRRFQADMRDIWAMQPRFERVTPRAIWRMIEQPRFRAAVDFLQMRAQAHEVDSVQAQWWMDLANADYDSRAILIENYQPPAGSREGATKRRRRRPRTRPAPQQT